MSDVIALFLYGWMVGIAALLLCYRYGVVKLLRLSAVINIVLRFACAKLSSADVITGTSNSKDLHKNSMPGSSEGSMDTKEQQQKHQLGHQGRWWVPCTGIRVSPARLTSVCQMSWYNEGEPPSVFHDCKLVLFDTYLMVYEVLASHGVGSHARVITSERFMGRLSMNRIVARRILVEQSGWRGSSASALKTHVLLISSRNANEPLFEGGNVNFKKLHNTSLPSAAKYKRMKGFKHGNANANVSSTEGIDINVRKNASGENCILSMSDASSDGRSASLKTIAVKFYYTHEQERWLNLLSGQEEAAQWCNYLQNMNTSDTFNIFLTRLLFQSMRTTALADFLRLKVQKSLDKLSSTKFPRGIEGQILLDDLILSSEVPTFSNVSTPQVLAEGEMTFDFDMMYRGGAVLCLRLNLSYRGIRIPHVVFSVKILRCAGRLHVSVGPPPSEVFWIGCLTPPDLSLEVHQGIESGTGLLHRILTSLPDLSGIVTDLLRLQLMSNMMMPVMDDFPLPSVEKTPLASPNLKNKSWKGGFNRQSAAARSRNHTETLEGTPFSPALSPSLSVSALGEEEGEGGEKETVNMIRKASLDTSAYTGDGGIDNDDNLSMASYIHSSTKMPLTPGGLGSHTVLEGGGVANNSQVPALTAEWRKRRGDTRGCMGLSPNSEDMQRWGLKSPKVMREHVTREAKLPALPTSSLEVQPQS